jgi:integral membrane protein
MMPSKIKTFATIAFLEGISFAVLLGIAMPLKYFFDLPVAVTVVGWAHGVLFMLYAFIWYCVGKSMPGVSVAWLGILLPPSCQSCPLWWSAG